MQTSLRRAALAALLLLGAGAAHAQSCTSLNAVDNASHEDFDTLATTGTANALALPGWQLSESGGGGRDNELYAADTGSGNTGDTISYGASGATERALGSLRSGSLIPVFGACFTNHTGAPLDALDITYTGEQWRLGTITRTDRLDFQYSLDAISVVSGTWVDVNALDFSSPATLTVGALNGNAEANRRALGATVEGLSIADGASFWVRWSDADASGADDGLAVDDFRLTPRGTGSGQVVLGVGDAAVVEGDDASSLLQFTVGLSQPAGPGGVTFRYSTTDGTATAASDYDALNDLQATIAEGATQALVSVRVHGDATPEADETLTLAIAEATGAVIADAQATGTILNDDFVITPIHGIQGNGATSPLAGQAVTTIGIVTGRKNNGFFLQSSDGDADTDPATSEGVFVFTGGAPTAAATVGNRVRVAGTVVEFVPPSDPGQLPLTEIGGGPVVALLSGGHALPTPAALGIGLPDPAGALDQLEHLEGMRVTASSLTVVAPTQGNTSEPNASGSSNGILHAVVTGVARPFREPGIQAPDAPPAGGTIPPIPRWDFNPELLTIDSDTLGGAAFVLDLATGSVIQGLTGPLDYGFRRYTLHRDPTVAIAVTPGPPPRAARAPDADEFTVAAYNLERFFDTVNDPGKDDPVLTAAAYEKRLGKASLGIRDYLNTPDVLGVVEVEKLPVLQTLAARINADAVANGQPDPQYVAFLEEGNDIGGIDVGFLVKTAGVAAGTARVEVRAVTQVGKDTAWTEPDGGSSLLNDRPPLVLDAVVHYADGRAFPVTVIVVHQRSLNGAEEDSAGGDRVRQKRQRQAEFLAALISARQSAAPDTRIVTLGDFNAFAFNDGYVDAMNVVSGTPTPDEQTVVPGDGTDLVDPDLVNLGELAPASERYSFVFDGNAQTLDHVLVNEELVVMTRSAGSDHARINADFPETHRNDANSPSRLADHDPVVAYFAPRRHADLAVTAAAAVADVRVGGTITFDATASNAGPEAADYPGIGFALDGEWPTMAVVAPDGWSCDAPQVEVARTSIACNASALANGATARFVVTAVATQQSIDTAVNLAVAADAQSFDAVPGNNQAGASIVVFALADLGVTLSGPPKHLRSGTSGQYRVAIAHAGGDVAGQVRLTLAGDAPAAAVAIDAPQGWSCTVVDAGPGFEAICSGDALVADAQRQFGLSILAPPRVGDGQLTVMASVESTARDPQPGNNSAVHSVRLIGSPH